MRRWEHNLVVLSGKLIERGRLSIQNGQPVWLFVLSVMNRVPNKYTGEIILNNTPFLCEYRGADAEERFKRVKRMDSLSAEGYLKIQRKPPTDGKMEPQEFSVVCRTVEWIPPQISDNSNRR